MEELKELLEEILAKQQLISATISKKRKRNQTIDKATVKPVAIKGEVCYQIARYWNNQVFHENVNSSTLIPRFLRLVQDHFRQADIFAENLDLTVLISKKGRVRLIKRPPSKELGELVHNRRKQYLLKEGVPYPFLVELGVMTSDGNVVRSKYDKFKQLNRFLEIVQDSITSLKPTKSIKVVDFGCGKAYLTFALYWYLVKKRGYTVEMIGLDLKSSVVEFCNQLACNVKFTGLQFQQGDIKEYNLPNEIDLVISLHACDTATDEAIIRAVNAQAKVLLMVPCCQHELARQIDNAQMIPMLKHGIIRERLSSLVTDSVRAQLLECVGYSAQIVEFIDTEHTPKNLLIRAFYTGKVDQRAIGDYRQFKEFWQIDPYLERMILQKPGSSAPSSTEGFI